jgi:aldehyde dehydrogenase (NAD+)
VIRWTQTRNSAHWCLVANATKSKPISNRAVELGRQEGAKLITGGRRPPGMISGWYVQPTVFDQVDSRMRIAQEEIFGPVLTVIPFADEDQALRIANDTEYGLAGSVWTSDVARGLQLSKQINAGTVGINHYAMDPGSPFGGIRNSGSGRELGPEGLAEFLYTKTTALPRRRRPA